MDKLRHMEIFAAVVETQKFSLAAERLGLTKSAVSHAVSGLEAHLGVTLLKRSARGVTLSADARSYYKTCRRILEDVYDLEDATRNSVLSMSGQIKIAAPTTYALTNIMPVIQEFTQIHPNINIILDLAERRIELSEHQIDLAVRVAPLETLTPQMRFLKEHEMMFLASPKFLAEHGPIRDLDDLGDLTGLIFSGLPTWPLYSDQGKIIDFKPRKFIETNCGQAIFDMTVNSMGVSYVPDFVAQPGLKDGRVEPFKLKNAKPYTLKSYLFFPFGETPSQRVTAFADLLTKRIRGNAV